MKITRDIDPENKKGLRRMGYRLRRNQYRNIELEPIDGPNEPDGAQDDPPGAGPEAVHSHGHSHGHGHKHDTDKAVEALRDQLLRNQAEFENFRKRVKREETARVDQAGQRVVEAVLPVLDNFGRALGNPGQSIEGLLAGMGMVHKQLEDILAQQGLEKINPQGMAFDPTQHEAVSVAPDTGQPDNTIVEVFQPGYALKGKLIRPAMVRVARG